VVATERNETKVLLWVKMGNEREELHGKAREREPASRNKVQKTALLVFLLLVLLLLILLTVLASRR
jgi:hypothetical protein